jgi:hypothetical protein
MKPRLTRPFIPDCILHEMIKVIASVRSAGSAKSSRSTRTLAEPARHPIGCLVIAHYVILCAVVCEKSYGTFTAFSTQSLQFCTCCRSRSIVTVSQRGVHDVAALCQ